MNRVYSQLYPRFAGLESFMGIIFKIETINKIGVSKFAGGIAKAALSKLRLWHERSRQRYKLSRLDGHLLRDVGLSEADVKQECCKLPWQYCITVFWRT